MAAYGPGAPPYELLKPDDVPNKKFPPRNGRGALDLTRILKKQTLPENRMTPLGGLAESRVPRVYTGRLFNYVLRK